jgi:FkbM family methyltransferase
MPNISSQAPLAIPTAAARDVSLAGLPLRVVGGQDGFWARAGRGEWEPQTLEAIRAEAGPGTIFLDVGAWIGATALLAASCGARVIALEPDPAARAQLLANLALNPALSAGIDVVDRALAATAAPIAIGPGRKAGDSMSSALYGAGPGAWTAAAITVSELDSLLPPAAPLLIKVDIEGGEYAVAADVAALARRRAGTVLLSLHPGLLARTKGQEACRAATQALAESFWDFAAERASAGAWRPSKSFNPGAEELVLSEWRLRPQAAASARGPSAGAPISTPR